MRSHRPNPTGRRAEPALPLAAVALLAAAPLGGCWQQADEGRPLVVDRTSPALGDPQQPVLLNDALTVYFSGDLRKMTVTEDSVTLLDEQGHNVPGTLEVGSNWVSFQPDPPLGADLTDGSFRPGARYRLQLAGQPRPDSIRAADGRWLDAAVTFDVFVADRHQAPAGLPSILRPTASELPFVVRRSEVPLYVAADDPRLLLHFTQPLLPSTVDVDAFQVQVLGAAAEIEPRSVRVLTSPIDDHPGSTVELDLGALPRLADGTTRALAEGDWISVAVRAGSSITDYGGQRPLPATASYWSVVEGRSLPICEWPGADEGFADEAGLAPGFEVVGTTIRPRVRVEAGNGALGVFRPQRDLTLRPGEPFDCGDGQLQVSNGPLFAFSQIDVPEGVTVTIDAQGEPVHLCATGGVRIAGEVRLLAPTVALPTGRFGSQPVADLVDLAPVSIVAAGDVQVLGTIAADVEITGSETSLLLASAANLRLRGTLPFQTMLVVEARSGEPGSRIDGARGQSRVYPATFTPGLASGSAFDVVGLLPWRQLPDHRDSGTLHLGGLGRGLSVEWQSTPADPIRGESPDTSAGRMGRWQAARDRDVVVAGAGAFVRLRLRATVHSGEPLPSIERLRLVEQR